MRELIPVLAVRDTVHFPGLINTLHVVREPSLKALRKANQGDKRVVVLSQKDMGLEEPKVTDLYEIGTLSEELQSIPLPDSSLRVALRGIQRVRARKIVERNGSFFCEIDLLDETHTDSLEQEAIGRAAIESFTRVVELNKEIPPEALHGVLYTEDKGLLADTILHHLPLRSNEKQAMLEMLDQDQRLMKTLELLKREEQILNLNSQIHARVERELGDTQREYYLREQLRIIQNELHLREDRIGETDEYRARITQVSMPPFAEQKALEELRRLDRSPASSPEGMVLRNYLDTLTSLPWNSLTEDRIDVNSAAKLLDSHHFGLEKIKDRVLDYLAVRQLKSSLKGPILCFVGPPGVGKTSLGRSIAEAMGRKFIRIALGGVRDEAEIRGHRRTYVGSMPGRIIQGLIECGSRNPVIVLDEIDKLAHGAHGDPMSALLEALDPEQNTRFSDHYVEVPFDLSEAMFITTANSLDEIPSPLRDRMEIIAFSGYTEEERFEIARRYLLPKNISQNGLSQDNIVVPDETLIEVVRSYTREAGVRSLDRQLGTLCRKVARQIAEGNVKSVCADIEFVQQHLGNPPYSRMHTERDNKPGVAWGLVVSSVGGEVVAVEVAVLPKMGAEPTIKLTGNLGDVMKESAMAALTVAQTLLNSPLLGDVHVHVPQGGVPKDGPSAGITILAAAISMIRGIPLQSGFAMTGEISLRGRVLPVGGIRDKILAAIASGTTDVIIPAENENDLDDLPPSARDKIKIHLVNEASEVIRLLLP